MVPLEIHCRELNVFCTISVFKICIAKYVVGLWAFSLINILFTIEWLLSHNFLPYSITLFYGTMWFVPPQLLTVFCFHIMMLKCSSTYKGCLESLTFLPRMTWLLEEINHLFALLYRFYSTVHHEGLTSQEQTWVPCWEPFLWTKRSSLICKFSSVRFIRAT